MNFYEKAHHQSAPCAEHDDLACSCFGSRQYRGGGIDPAAYASNEPLPDLVMNSATGLPMAESGNGWTYSGGKLTLTSGEWNFSYTHPANGAGETLSEVKCIVQINEGATVTGGTFTKVVNNGVNDRENKAVSLQVAHLRVR